MALYRVTWNGMDILDYSKKESELLNPKVELEINTSGSFEFTVPPYHERYEMFTDEQMMTSMVEVYEGDEIIFFGRPIEKVIDFNKNKKIYCEGALAYLNDSVQRPMEYDDNTHIANFFESIIGTHNGQVSAERQFNIGSITISDTYVYRKMNYESTFDAVENMCLGTNSGYIFVRRVNGVNFIDWHELMPYTSNQIVEFGKNLLDLSIEFDGNDFYTCILPVGATINDNNSDTNIRDSKALTVAGVNGGSDVIDGPLVSTYGRITKAENFSDVKYDWELMTYGRKRLEDTAYNTTMIECEAVDLHNIDPAYEAFRIGQNVMIVSPPHNLNRILPLSKLSLQLDSAVKKISLGIIKKKPLSRITKEQQQEIEQQQQDFDDYTDGQDPYDPPPYVPPADSLSDNQTIDHIVVTKLPNKYTYSGGETIDYTGIEVTLFTKTGQIFKNSDYPDGKIPYGQLILTKKAARKSIDETGSDDVPVKWTDPYAHVTLSTKFTIIAVKFHLRGQISTGGWDPNNIQQAEVNTIRFSRAGIYYVGCVEPSRKMYLVAVSALNQPFNYEYKGITNGSQTDHGSGNSATITVQGTTLHFIAIGPWYDPRPTPKIPTTPCEDSSNDARKKGLSYILGVEVP